MNDTVFSHSGTPLHMLVFLGCSFFISGRNKIQEKLHTATGALLKGRGS